jgi:hypothetical protein
MEHTYYVSRVFRDVRCSISRRRLAVLLTVLCVCGAIGGIGGVAGTNADGAVAAQETATPTPTNNTSVQQENPEEVARMAIRPRYGPI